MNSGNKITCPKRYLQEINAKYSNKTQKPLKFIHQIFENDKNKVQSSKS